MTYRKKGKRVRPDRVCAGCEYFIREIAGGPACALHQ